MGDQLQPLIDRIQKEAVEKAEQRANEIVSEAEKKKAAILQEAEEKAAALIKKADEDSTAYAERSTRALEQASRDVLITVGQGVENVLSDLVGDALDEALRVEVLEEMLIKIAEAYIGRGGDVSRVDLLISEADQKRLIKFFTGRYRERLKQGLEVHVDKDIIRGFKVSLVDERVQHSFDKESIAEALCNFLRPHLAEIVHRVARNGDRPAGDAT